MARMFETLGRTLDKTGGGFARMADPSVSFASPVNTGKKVLTGAQQTMIANKLNKAASLRGSERDQSMLRNPGLNLPSAVQKRQLAAQTSVKPAPAVTTPATKTATKQTTAAPPPPLPPQGEIGSGNTGGSIGF